MSDGLRDQFEAFRSASAARTQPPGVPAIQRTLTRRHARRAIGFAVAAAAAILLAFLPLHLPRGGAPTHPPAPADSQTATPSPTPSPSATVAQTTTPPTTVGASASCNPYQNVGIASLIASGSPDVFTLTDALLKDCPGITLHITRAVYIGSGSSSTKLTLYSSTTHVVSPTARTTTMPAAQTPAGTCYTSLVVTLIGSGLPKTVTNIVPEISSAGSDEAATFYFNSRGFDLITTAWSNPIC